MSAGGQGQLETNIFRATPSYEEQRYTWTGNFPTGGESWSDMIYAPADCVTAVVSILEANGGEGSAWLADPTC